MQDLDGIGSTAVQVCKSFEESGGKGGAAGEGGAECQSESVCQNPKCLQKSKAVKVCHHSDCRDANHDRPFLLCHECSDQIHKQRSRSGHLCLDIPKRRGHHAPNFSPKTSISNPLWLSDCKRRCSEGDAVRTGRNSIRLENNRNEYWNSLKIHKGFNGVSDKCPPHSSDEPGQVEKSSSHEDDVQLWRHDQNGVDGQLNGTHADNDRGSHPPKHDHELQVISESGFEQDSSKDLSGETICISQHQRSQISDCDSPSDSNLNVAADSSCVVDEESVDKRENDCEDEQVRRDLVDVEGCVDEQRDWLSGHDSCVSGGEQDCHDRNNRFEDAVGANEDVSKSNGQCSGNNDVLQDEDEDFTEPESSSLNLRLKRKKVVKIRKPKVQKSANRTAVSYNNKIYDSKVSSEIPDPKSSEDDTREFAVAMSPRNLPSKFDTKSSTEKNCVSNELKSHPPQNGALKTDSGSHKANGSCDKGEEVFDSSSLSSCCESSEVRPHHPTNLLIQEDVRKKTFEAKFSADCENIRKFSLTNEHFVLRHGTEEQLVVAPRGLPLGRAISNLVWEKWGLAIEQCDVFLNSSNSPLPLSSDCYLLAFNTLWLKVKENKTKKPVRVDSPSPATEKAKLNGNVKVASGDPMRTYANLRGSKRPTGIQAIFQFSSKTQDKQEHLNELLTEYASNGIPKMPDLLTLGRIQYDPSIFVVEPHWKDIVTRHSQLTKPQRDQQEAIWELLTTEIEYIRKIRIVIDLFMCCLFNIQNEQLLNEIEAEKLFSNIDDVFYATCHFWNVHMSQVLKRSRETREILNPSLLKSGFLVFDKMFDPYTKYCLEQNTCQEYIRLKTKDNELFRHYVQWVQSQTQCRLLRLQDILCEPWQRLMRYPLLLKKILKYTEQIEHPSHRDQVEDLENMIEQVEKFVADVNVAMRRREESQQMSKLMSRIESYEIVEAPNDEAVKLLGRFSKLDLLAAVPGCGPREMRMLIWEGSLKLKDAFSRADVYCFLFTDLFLITKLLTKRSGDKMKVIKPPMRLDKISIHSLRDSGSFMVLYLNEYHVAQAIYTFQGDARIWMEMLKKAQSDYKDKRYQYCIRPDHLFDIRNYEDDGDDDIPTFAADSPSDSVRENGSLGRNSYSSSDAHLPNSSSEVCLFSAVERSDASKSNTLNSDWKRKSRTMASSGVQATNPRLNSSCDHLTSNGLDSGIDTTRRLYLSPTTSGTSSKVAKAGRPNTKDERSVDEYKPAYSYQRNFSDSVWKKPEKEAASAGTGRDVKDDTKPDDWKPAYSYQRHFSDSVGKPLDRDSFLSKRPSWSSESRRSNELHRNQSLVHQPKFSQQFYVNLKRSVDSAEPLRSRISSAKVESDQEQVDPVRLNRHRASASVPVITKSTFADGFSDAEDETAMRQRLDEGFRLDDCTLEATDV